MVAGEVEDFGVVGGVIRDRVGTGPYLVLEVAVVAAGHGVAGEDEAAPAVLGDGGVRRAGGEQEAFERGVVADEQALAPEGQAVQRHEQRGDRAVNGGGRDGAGFDGGEGAAHGEADGVREVRQARPVPEQAVGWVEDDEVELQVDVIELLVELRDVAGEAVKRGGAGGRSGGGVE